MDLVRFAILDGHPGSAPDWGRLGLEDGRVAIRMQRVKSPPDTARFLVIGRVHSVSGLTLTSDRKIRVPSHEHREIESAIERLSYVFGIAEHSRRRLRSPIPGVAFVPDPTSGDDIELLRGATGIECANAAIASSRLVADARVAFDSLGQRMDGAALLSEAIDNQHATGKYLGVMRVFERAFRLGPEGLKEPLATFLATGKFGYTAAEVSSWISRRAEAAHADRRKTFALESDLRAIALRMEQAGYDVLFNKLKWRDPGTERRDQWRAIAGTNSPGLSHFVTKGHDAMIVIHALDEFGTWPVDLTVGLDGSLDKLAPGAVMISGEAD